MRWASVGDGVIHLLERRSLNILLDSEGLLNVFPHRLNFYLNVLKFILELIKLFLIDANNFEMIIFTSHPDLQISVE